MRYPWSRALLALTIVVLMSVTASAAVVYVKWDSPGPTFDGTSWETAFQKVQQGLNAATSGDEVWVAEGTYVECIILKDGVGLYGGFLGVETARDQRNFRTNETILDANQQGSVVQALTGVTASTVLDGFSIRNGSGTNVTSAGMRGGGVFCDSASPVISNNLIVANRNYALYCRQSLARIVSNRVEGNVEGSILCSGGSPLVANNRLVGNTGGQCSGVDCTQSSMPLIANNLIGSNKVTPCIRVVSASSPLIVNNTVVNNQSVAIYAFSADATVSVYNNIIAFNVTGIEFDQFTHLVVRNNCLFGNANHDYNCINVPVPSPVGTNGNISVDPRFGGTNLRDIHLQGDSPCRDAGDDLVVQGDWSDLDGQARLQGNHVDIGADESDGTEWATAARVVRVSPDGRDAADGSSWSTAKRTVQAGIDTASVDGGEVWVRAGIYSEHIVLTAYVHVYGGFDGTEVERHARSWHRNTTVLDGANGSSVVTADNVGYMLSGIDGFVIQCAGTDAGVRCKSAAVRVVHNVIKLNKGGIHITNGRATVANNVIMANRGAPGITCRTDYSRVINNTIIGNGGNLGFSPQPGGIYCYTSAALFANNIIAFNGIGIMASGDTSGMTIRHNCAYGNSVDYYPSRIKPEADGNLSQNPGLGCVQYMGHHILPESLCRDAGDNSCVEEGSSDIDGDVRIHGAHVDIGADESDGTLWPETAPRVFCVSPYGDDSSSGLSWAQAKKTIQAGIEAARREGGEIWVQAGTYSGKVELEPFVYLYGGFIGDETEKSQRAWSDNQTVLSGEMEANSIGLEMTRVDGFTIRDVVRCMSAAPLICNNTVTGKGIKCNLSSACIIGNVIRNCASYGDGGGINVYDSAPQIINNTIAGNSAKRGGAVCVSGRSSPLLAGNILAFNSSGVFVFILSDATLRCNNEYGNAEYGYSGIPDPTGTDGNISADPLFVDRANGDYHLKPISPCVNAGWSGAPDLPETDIDGESRVLYGAVDIGADECSGTIDVLREAKMAANGLPISLTDAIVTATLDGFFYLEAPNRSVGIRVEKSAHGLTAGDMVNVTGTMGTNADGERFIEAFSVARTGSGSIDPLHISPAALGGGGWRHVASTGAGQEGVVGGLGLNNIGMYVRTWGKLTYIGGSYVLSGTGLTPSDKHVLEGLRTICRETYVRVNGVVSCYRAADGLHPIIIATEIQPL